MENSRTAGPGTHPDAHPDADAWTIADADADPRSRPVSDTDSRTFAIPDADPRPKPVSDANADPRTNSYADTGSLAHADPRTISYPITDTPTDRGARSTHECTSH